MDERSKSFSPVSSLKEEDSGKDHTSLFQGPPEIRDKLDTQVENWRKKLLDLGNRNSLINCSFSPSHGVVEILHPDTESVWRKLAAENEAGAATMRFPWRRDLVPAPPGQIGLEVEDGREWNPPFNDCISSPRCRPNDLMTGATDKALNRRFRTLSKHAELSLTEQGVHCLFVAFGFLKWFESPDSEQELISPLMLVPVSLRQSTSDAPWELSEAEDDVLENLCLRQRLKQDFGFELPLLPDIDELEKEDARLRFLNSVRLSISENTRWQVEDRCALGRFAFPKIAMWKNLSDNRQEVISHPICRSIVGDSAISPKQAFGSILGLPDAARLDDEVAPGEIKAILDCDSSQVEAIVAARRGVSFVLDGPPGTGKSQTIANIIADAIGEGRKVLFVSEKVSALEVVKRRLDEFGIGDFCLECHSTKANRAAVLEKLRMCLELPVEVYPDTHLKLGEVKRIRESLNRYVRAVHTPRPPLGLSPYELFGQVSRLERIGMATKSRCHLPPAASVTREHFCGWINVLKRAEDVDPVITTFATHPWRGCKKTSKPLSFSDDLKHHFGNLVNAFRVMDEVTQPFVIAGQLPPQTPSNLQESLRALRNAGLTPEVSESWLRNPASVANAVLTHRASSASFDKCIACLNDYSGEAPSQFPIDVVPHLTSSNDSNWISRIREPLPKQLRESLVAVSKCVASLDEVTRSSESLEESMSTVMDYLQVPRQRRVMIGAIPQLAVLAKAVASSAPLRDGWFESVNWTRLRQSVSNAIGNIDDAERAAATLKERLKAEKIPLLQKAFPEPQVAESLWTKVQTFVPSGQLSELRSKSQWWQEISVSLTAIQDQLRSLCHSVGIDDDSDMPITIASNLAEWGISLSQPVTFHGSWSDSATRVKLLKSCSEAIADLTEAGEIRRQLEDRLSHRAFKSNAADIARKSVQYGSRLKRLLGGFASYRQEVAELYKSSVPSTEQLLDDMGRLIVYHRRETDSTELAGSLTNLLPDDHTGDSLESWMRLSASLESYEQLSLSVPSISTRLRPHWKTLGNSDVKSRAGELKTRIDDVQVSLNVGTVTQQSSSGESVADLSDRARRISADLKACCQLIDRAEQHFEQLPSDFPQFLNDILNATRYTEASAEINALYEREREFMPYGAVPDDKDQWKRVITGIESAQLLCRLVPSISAIKEVLCTDGKVDSAGLLEACDSLEASYQRLLTTSASAELLLVLAPPDETAVDVIRSSPEELRLLAEAASGSLNRHACRLSEIARFVLADRDIPLERLSKDAEVIAKAKLADSSMKEAESTLKSLDAEWPKEAIQKNYQAAEWLLTASSSGSITPLQVAAATNPQLRELAADAATQIKRVCNEQFMESWKFLQTVFDTKAELSTGQTLAMTTYGQLSEFLSRLSNEVQSLDDWLKFCRWQRDMSTEGLDVVVEELLAGKYSSKDAVDAVSARFYRDLFDHLISQDSDLAEFDIDGYERLREKFRELDKWEVEAAATRIRQFQLGREDRPRTAEFSLGSSELGILMREVKKKRGHKPLRKLFAEIPRVLQSLTPCIMMSPLSVSTFLQTNDIRFDLVIFDEASQVFPWDAIGAIYRGNQLIVAGDEQQLPPTNFFSRADIESEDEDDEIGDFESILGVCKAMNMPNKRLRWHYRSRREPLIAFSNRHFYSGELVTFPSVRDASHDSVQLDFVSNGRWIDRKNLVEAERVADLVIQHHRQRTGQSIGVISFSASQQRAIEDTIYERRRNDPEIDALFELHSTEPFFVKNLENVQGDERDIIILSMGYARNDAGKFLNNFGPLSKAGGARRLNVAVTRARERMVFVSSVRAVDLDLSGSTSEGAHLLKGYLDYAERGVDSLGTSVTLLTQECESPFEEEVAAALIRRGLEPVSQVGCGGFRIDMALKHPDRPGQFCLGIECDGATYHSSRTARDRDRIRQSVLEDLGWKIVRVWSTDWVQNPEKQILRIIAAYEHAIALPDTDWSPLPTQSENDAIDEDLQPQIINPMPSVGRKYSKIEEVPDLQIRELATSVLARVGTTNWDDLVVGVARELGFSRTGRKIRDRIVLVLQSELRSGKLHHVGDRIALQEA